MSPAWPVLPSSSPQPCVSGPQGLGRCAARTPWCWRAPSECWAPQWSSPPAAAPSPGPAADAATLHGDKSIFLSDMFLTVAISYWDACVTDLLSVPWRCSLIGPPPSPCWPAPPACSSAHWPSLYPHDVAATCSMNTKRHTHSHLFHLFFLLALVSILSFSLSVALRPSSPGCSVQGGRQCSPGSVSSCPAPEPSSPQTTPGTLKQTKEVLSACHYIYSTSGHTDMCNYPDFGDSCIQKGIPCSPHTYTYMMIVIWLYTMNSV